MGRDVCALSEYLESCVCPKSEVNTVCRDGQCCEPPGSALQHALKHGTLDIIRLLLLYGADVQAPSQVLLHILWKVYNEGCANIGRLEESPENSPPLASNVILSLLMSTVDLAATDAEGNTPLHILLRCPMDSLFDMIVETMLLKGANVDAVNVHGDTPLHTFLSASERWFRDGKVANRPSIVRCLLKHGANANAKTKSGDAPLHLVVRYCEEDAMELVRSLTEYGADVNAKTKSGDLIAANRTAFEMIMSRTELIEQDTKLPPFSSLFCDIYRVTSVQATKNSMSSGFHAVAGSFAGLAIQEKGPTLPMQLKASKDSRSQIEYYCQLDVDSPPFAKRLSGIVCTIGPASNKVDTLSTMIGAGMNIARLNFSHGTHEYHAGTIANVREANKLFNERFKRDFLVGIALDTKGPEIRTGLLEGGASAEVELKVGDTIRITTDEAYADKCTGQMLYVDYANITSVVRPGNLIYIDDGLISVRARQVTSNYIDGAVENGGLLGSKKGVNLPGVPVDLPAVSEKDQQDLLFGVKQGVDMVFASFIRDGQGVRDIRKLLNEAGGSKIMIISKIENQQGIHNIDEIIKESDGIMVARGDMGIEIPPQKVFVAQKMIIAKCNREGKPVICATQMLESMVHKPRPTRAEVSDVANAIMDGADCIMLSGETAKGDFPVVCVSTMADIAREAEAVLWNRNVFVEITNMTEEPQDSTHAVSMAAVKASYTCMASAIIVITTSGRSAHLASKYKPRCPIIAVTRFEQTARQCHLWRGVIPCHYQQERVDDWIADVDKRVRHGIEVGKKGGFVNVGDAVVVVTGWRKGSGFTNTMRIFYVDDQNLFLTV
ncbi:unnamed protein product [Cyprideis torosa]|uniref:Pyruvate kinase n=1 Tax=Cyprideis torosa TaxID=163714 RepID=A0A7R8W993_9CRUS|nr:unnamed protein product [Cyprideis torosa]CAG0889514.1 unnamed protein product [Cyprideis torosa]